MGEGQIDRSNIWLALERLTYRLYWLSAVYCSCIVTNSRQKCGVTHFCQGQIVPRLKINKLKIILICKILWIICLEINVISRKKLKLIGWFIATISILPTGGVPWGGFATNGLLRLVSICFLALQNYSIR